VGVSTVSPSYRTPTTIVVSEENGGEDGGGAVEDFEDTAMKPVLDNGWRQDPFRWIADGREHISVSFTWQLPALREELANQSLYYGRPIVGGPAVRLLPQYLADVAEVSLADYPGGVLHRMNPQATRTTVGCPNRCEFCGVHRLEGEFRELDDWPAARVICDSNLLAASMPHFERVVHRLRGIVGVDFQGIDAGLLRVEHARLFAKLDCSIRLAFDTAARESALLRAVARLRAAGLPRKRMRVYVLIGWQDAPEEAAERLSLCYYGLGILPTPMRYVPLDSLSRHWVGPGWTDEELTAMQRYWSNLCAVRGVSYWQWREYHRAGVYGENGGEDDRAMDIA